MSINITLGLPTIVDGNLVPTWKDSLYLSYAFSTEVPMHFMQTKRASMPHSQPNTDINTSSTPLVQFFPFNASPQFRSEFSDTSNVNVNEVTQKE